MQDQHVPSINLHYWAVFAAAGLVGSNAGDLVTSYMELWLVDLFYVPLMALALIAILVIEGTDRSTTRVWYWLAILVIPMAASDLSASAAMSLGLGRIWVIGGLVIVLIATFMMVRSDAMHLVAISLMARPRPTVPLTDTCYWVAMVIASTLGSVGSDFVTHNLGLSTALASLVLSAVVVAMFLIRPLLKARPNVSYWPKVVAINAAASTIGRFLAEDPRLHIGLPLSVLLSGGLMVGLLLLPRRAAGDQPG